MLLSPVVHGLWPETPNFGTSKCEYPEDGFDWVPACCLSSGATEVGCSLRAVSVFVQASRSFPDDRKSVPISIMLAGLRYLCRGAGHLVQSRQSSLAQGSVRAMSFDFQRVLPIAATLCGVCRTQLRRTKSTRAACLGLDHAWGFVGSMVRK